MKAVAALAALAALLVCAAASATSPCPPDVPCDPDEFPVLVAATLVGLKNACARTDPPRAQQYSAALEKMLDTDLGAEDREAMRKARNAPLFSAKLKEAEWALDALQGAELERECAALLEAKF